MAYMVKYQMDTNTYQIKHATSCESCRNKTGNSIAVMKIVINDDGDTEYSLKFKEMISLSQLKTLTMYIEQYVDEVIEV
jgi:hypothetical protein|tara:strand:- start:483 stop:719 length:237 start_codon:yes stop_codon:yes gene_type:complete